MSITRLLKSSPLDGIKVLDMTRVLAGPYCTMLLGDLGAEVIKIENPSRGDDTRQWGPPFKNGESAYFLSVNRNKQSLTVNLKTKSGIEIIKKLVKESDVFIENYVPGKLEKLGLGYEDLIQLNPRLIYTSVYRCPFSHRAGYDVIIEAEAGLMHITGGKKEKPVKVGVAITDLTTGLYAHGAVMAALLQRAKTNKGQKIDVSLLECQVASLANIASSWLIGNIPGERWGTEHPSIVPYQAFDTSDGTIVIGAGNDAQYQKLASILKDPDLLRDEYKTNYMRVKNRDILCEKIASIISEKPTKEWLELLEDTGIPFGPVNDIKKTFEHPQVIHRNMVQTINHPKAGEIDLVGPAVKYSQGCSAIRTAPPTIGQHNHSILKRLGYSKEQIQDFEQKGVI